MAKVYHVTLMVELDDDADPEDLDWTEAMMHLPGVTGFSLLDLTQRPFSSMEEDHVTHTKH